MDLLSSTFCIFHILTTLSSILASPSTLTNETDMLALLQFKAGITDDPLQAMNSWNHSLPLCNWHGVTCGVRHPRVTLIDLHSLNLAGSISPHIGNLSFLKQLLLQNNSFIQNIPPEFGGLLRLQTLDLRNNSLSGDIPGNLSRCRSLVEMRLDFNDLDGKLPADFGYLTNLQVLSVRDNNLVGGIPLSFGNLSLLVELRMAMNKLGGEIPRTLGRLQYLKLFAIGGNNLFSGNIPTSIFNISSMETFDVGENMLRGTLPSNIFISWPNIVLFSIAANNFTGSIPSSISNASNLSYFSIPSNSLTGSVPSLEKLHNLRWFAIGNNSLGLGEANDLSFIASLTNATSLESLTFGPNKFGGKLPESVGNLSTTLRRFIAQQNQVVGTIPTGVTNLASLEVLVMTNNHLSGDIPRDIGNLRNLRILYLGDNNLTGFIPSSIGNLDKLLRLYLSRNELVGHIPPHLGNCTSLLQLSIAQNSLSGHIPLQIFNITTLALHLNLFQNQFTGPLPPQVGNLRYITQMDISGNKLSGEIPASLASCVTLEFLNLMENSFHGTLPSSLSSLRSLRSLDLSRNNLSGEIPRFLQDFVFLEYLNCSFNKFTGMVPTAGVFKNVSRISVARNDELCGGIRELQLPPCGISDPAKSGRNRIVVAAVLSSLAAAMIISSFFFFLKRKRKNNVVTDSSDNSLLQVSYRTLFKSTDGFSPGNLIGVGSFGSVYKGILEDGRVVAVKVFDLQRRGGCKSFITECKAVRNIRHRNLVKVITACSSIDIQEHDFKALVYEFMVNGSLEEWLHPNPEEDGVVKKLSFVQRLDIAIDVASAIEYLHHQYGHTPVVHCDLKPSNVLLDDVMTAQVGDFGLVRFLGEGTDGTKVDQMSSVGVRGTVGYAAPEYGMGSELSTQGDVYSYGILLLEMFSGKRPTDDMFNHNLNLHNYVKTASLEHVADVVIFENDESESSNGRNQKIIESLCLILEVGVACSEEVPRDRMDISDALAKLSSFRANLTTEGDLGGRGHAIQSAEVTNNI